VIKNTNKSIASVILNLGTGWMCVVASYLRRFTSGVNVCGTHRRLNGLQSRPESFIFFAFLGFEPGVSSQKPYHYTDSAILTIPTQGDYRQKKLLRCNEAKAYLEYFRATSACKSVSRINTQRPNRDLTVDRRNTYTSSRCDYSSVCAGHSPTEASTEN
jgi:hypothetical protein